MGDDLQQFDDPALQAAIRQLRGGHKAPAELRAAVARRLAEARAAEAGESPVAGRIAPEPSRRSRSQAWKAIAAVLLIAIAGTSIYLQTRDNRPKATAYARNDALLDSMVAIQAAGVAGDASCKPLSAPISNSTALADEARVELKRSVPAVDLKSLGWTLDAASFCSINGSPAVRFHFTREGHGMTFVSLPSSAWGYSKDDDQYQQSNDGYPIAGYVKDGSLNCVVGEKSMPLDEAIALRDRIRGG